MQIKGPNKGLYQQTTELLTQLRQTDQWKCGQRKWIGFPPKNTYKRPADKEKQASSKLYL